MSRGIPSNRDGEGGFTMIEALVALALVAVMLTAVGSLVASAAIGTRTQEQHVALVETARLIAASRSWSTTRMAWGNPTEVISRFF